MSIALVINGVSYDYPEVDDVDWGPDATDWAAAVTNGMLQKAGGLFQLLSELDFGTAYGIKSLYVKSRTANPADDGIVRLGKTDLVNWRNNANSANLTLGISASDNLQFNGVDIQPGISVSDTATIDLSFALNVLSADIKSDSITNAMINSAAAIAYSKLNLAASVANSDLVTMAQATIKGRAAGAGTGAPVDLSATQATAILNAFVGDSGAGGTKGLAPAPAAGDAAAGRFLKADGTWSAPAGSGDVVGPASATDNGFVRFNGTTGKLVKDSAATISNADVNAAAAIAYSKLALSASIVNADIAAAAAIAYSKLAALTINRALVSDGSGVVSVAPTTATEIGYVNGVTSAIQTQINAKLPTTVTTTGDLIYSSSGTTASRLALGTAPQILKAGATIPGWAYPLSAQVTYSITGSIASGNDVVFLDATSAAITRTLPTAASVAGKTFILKKIDSSANAVTIDTTSSQTIDGNLTYALRSPNEAITVVSDGTNWKISNIVSGAFVFSGNDTFANWPVAAGVYFDAASVQLVPGDWEIITVLAIQNTGATTASQMQTGISTTSGNSATGLGIPSNTTIWAPIPQVAGGYSTFMVPNYRITPTVTTTYYMKAVLLVSVTNIQYSYRMQARRWKG